MQGRFFFSTHFCKNGHMSKNIGRMSLKILSTDRKVFKECAPTLLGVLVTFSAKSGSFSAETCEKRPKMAQKEPKIQGLSGRFSTHFRLIFEKMTVCQKILVV